MRRSSVIYPDGMTHIEETVGNVRRDLTTGEVTTVIGAPGSNMAQVVRPDGTVAMETTVANVRTSSDGLGPVTITAQES